MNLFCYVIDHVGGPRGANPQPRHEKNCLILDGCMEQMRPSVKVGNWVLATLGKKFPRREGVTEFSKKIGDSYWQYLVYAMRVACVEDRKYALISKDFFIFEPPIKMDKKFHVFIKKKQQGHLRFPHNKKEETLITAFENWVRKKRAYRNLKSSIFSPVRPGKVNQPKQVCAEKDR